MSDTEETTEESEISLVRGWASDWADTFDQTWTPELLRQWVGKTVKAEGVVGEERKGFVKTIVGYSVDTLVIEDRAVIRASFITSEGTQVALFTDMRVEEHEE